MHRNSRGPSLLRSALRLSRFKRSLCFLALAIIVCILLLQIFTSSKDLQQQSSTYASIKYKNMVKDNKPTAVANKTNDLNCDVINIVLVCVGYNRTRDVPTLMKSIVFHQRRANLLHFYFVSDPIATTILRVLMQSWNLSDVSYSFINADQLTHEVSWIRNYHYSGNYGLMKLALPSLLATHADLHSAIVLDTDLLFAKDIALLWDYFKLLSNKKAAIGLADNLSDWYLEPNDDPLRPRWPALGRGFNTGVMLLNIDALVALNWTALYQQTARTLLPRYGGVMLADQDIFNAVLATRPELVYRLPCVWNMQLSLQSRLDELCPLESIHDIAVVHWNTPTKQQKNYYFDEVSGKRFLIRNRQHYFNMHQMFQQLDGNLLRHDESTAAARRCAKQNPVTIQYALPTILDSFIHSLLNISKVSKKNNDNLVAAAAAAFDAGGGGFDADADTDVDDNNNLDASSGYCNDFRYASQTLFRMHLFYAEYNSTMLLLSVKSSSSPSEFDFFDADDVTLVTQFSIDRLHQLVWLTTNWAGPISLAIYASDAEAPRLLDYLDTFAIFHRRRNIAYHVVYRDGALYPINLLRNVALKTVQTPYVFLTDIDFVPKPNMYDTLRATLRRYAVTDEKVAYVVPAFETQRYYHHRAPDDADDNNNFPVNKSMLLDMWHVRGEIAPFRFDVWPQGHAPTNFIHWAAIAADYDESDDAEPYEVQWKQDYEPYIVVATRNLPAYDQRFLGFGWNKVAHLMQLTVQGYRFLVLPNEFLIHMPHAPSFEITRFRTSERYKKCLLLLKCEFVNELTKEYGKSATKELMRNATEMWCSGTDRYLRQFEKFGW